MLRLARTLTLGAIRGMASFINKFSMSFDGIQENLQTTADDTVQPTTYSFWAKSSTTGQNIGVFGHGGDNIAAFHFNWSDSGLTRPLLYLGSNYYRFWNDTTAQDNGEWNHWVVYSDTNDITNSKLYVNGVLQTASATVSSGSTTAYTESLTIGADRQNGGNHFEGQIDEFAVYHKELSQAEIDVLYNTYYGDNIVQNGDFEEEGAEEVTNGDFATDLSGWSGQAGRGSYAWENGKGKITNDDTSSYPNLSQSVNTVAGKVYKITATVEIGTATLAEVRAFSNSNIGSQQLTTDGTIEFYVTADDTDFLLLLYLFEAGNTGNYCYFDNVSVKEVGQHWNQSGTWNSTNYVEFNGSSARLVTDGTGVGVKQTPMVVGREYKLTFDVIAAALGSAKFDGASINFSSVGSYSTTFTAAQTSLAFFRNSGAADITIDNVVLQELKHKATNLLKDSGDYTSSADLEHYYRMGDGKLDSYPTIFDQKGSDNATMTNMSSGNILQDTPVTS